MPSFTLFFFFNDTATTEIYTLSLHDALPIYEQRYRGRCPNFENQRGGNLCGGGLARRNLSNLRRGDRFSAGSRSEEHTSELQSRLHLVCRLLLEKKKNKEYNTILVQEGSMKF